MTPDERRELDEVAIRVARVRNAMVYRGEYNDIDILGQVINEIVIVLDNDDERNKLEEKKNDDQERDS